MGASTFRRCRAFATVCIVAVAAGLTVAVPSAQAFNLLGCRYASDDPEIDIDALVFSGYTWPLGNAVADWNGETVPGHFDLSPGTSAIELSILRWSSTESHWASTAGSVECPALSGGDSSTYYGNDVDMYLNDATMASLTATQRKLVIEHELGHALGLAHMPSGCGQVKAVMQQGASKWACGWTGTAPWKDDVDGVKARY